MLLTRRANLLLVLLLCRVILAGVEALAEDVAGAVNPKKLPTLSSNDLLAIESQLRLARKKVLPSIVNVLRPDVDSSAGASGTVVSSDGLVLTHCHSGQMPGTRVRVMLIDGRKVGGEYLGCHREFDLALIQIDKGEKGPWPAIEISTATECAVGDFCFALSYPGSYFALDQVPLMRVSRVLKVTSRHVSTGMHIQPGDSGGGLFTTAGTLIAIGSETNGPESLYSLAEVLSEIRCDLLASRLISKSDFAEPFDRTQWSALAKGSHKSVVRVLADNIQISLGVIVGKEGLIVSRSGDQRNDLVCVLSDGSRHNAVMRAVDSEHGLSLLKIDASGLPVATWSKRSPSVGMIVATVGSDTKLMGLGTIATPVLAVTQDPQQRFPNVFMHDALAMKPKPGWVTATEISDADLGGPVVDSQGRVIGINIDRMPAKFGHGRHVYAVPTDMARSVIDRLRRE